MPGRLLAERLGEFLHAGIVRWGSRAYPNALFVACWEGAPGGAAEEDGGEGMLDGEAGFQLYVVDPSGASRRHRAACTGRGSSRARKWLHRRAAAASSTAARSGVATAEQGVGGDSAPAEHEDEQDGAPGSAKSPSSSAAELRDRQEEEGEEEQEDGGSEESEDRGDGVEGSDRSDDEDDEDGDDDGDDDEEGDSLARSRGAQLEHSNGPRRRGGVRKERRRQRQRRQQRLPLSQMTCAEAARALIREARRVRAGEPGKSGAGGDGGGADGQGDVAGLPEVAWLTVATKTRSDMEEGGRGGEGPVFVHHRSMEELFGNQPGEEKGHR